MRQSDRQIVPLTERAVPLHTLNSPEFKLFIQRIMSKYITLQEFNSLNFDLFKQAFTTRSARPYNNLETLEQIGDGAVHSFLQRFMYDKFPRLLSQESAVSVVSRILVTWGASDKLAYLANTLGFWPFICADAETRSVDKTKCLEDVFEAFLGACIIALSPMGKGAGASFTEAFLTDLFERANFTVNYKSLYDSITRFKELLDYYAREKPAQIPVIYFDEVRNDNYTCSCTAYELSPPATYELSKDGKMQYGRVRGKKPGVCIARADAMDAQEAKKIVCESLITNLEKRGITRPLPRAYHDFETIFAGTVLLDASERPYDTQTILDQFSLAKSEINELRNHEGRSRHTKVLLSPLLVTMCKWHNVTGVYACLELGADVSICDSAGFSCVDRVLMGCASVEVKKDLLTLIRTYHPLPKPDSEVALLEKNLVSEFFFEV